MNPNEEKIAQFLSDDVMYNAVKAILFSEFDLNIQYDATITGAERYEQVQAILKGRTLLEKGFKALDVFKRDPQPSEPRQNIV